MTEAVSRYSTAMGYFQAALMIYRSEYREGREILVLLPMCMLAGFALELYLMAWLLASGHGSGEVRGYGHRVRDLYAAAKVEGLPEIRLLDELVTSLAPGHEDFTFRYMEEGGTAQVPDNWDATFGVLDQLDNVVDEHTGASAAKGLLPGRYS